MSSKLNQNLLSESQEKDGLAFPLPVIECLLTEICASQPSNEMSFSLIGDILRENNPQLSVSKIVESTTATLKVTVPAIATNEDPDLTPLIPERETEPDELLNRGFEIIENIGVSDCILSLTFLDTYFSAMVCNNALSIGEKFTLKDMFLEKLGYPIEFSNK